MAPDKLSRDPGQGGDRPSEGVRIIAAEELEEVAERREVVRRRAPDEPGFKDRPPAPPADVRPAIRFPLPDRADASSLARPRPAPVDPPRAVGSVDRAAVETTAVSIGAADSTVPDDDPIVLDDEPVVLDGEREPVVLDGEPVVLEGEPGGSEPTAAGALAPSPLPPPPAAAPALLDVGPSTGEHALPHWTEPPTGEVPKIVVGESDHDPGDDERWASFAADAPRWRDEHDTTDHGDLMADLAAPDEDSPSERLGALDTRDRLSDEAYLNFDDVDLDPGGKRGRRGSRRFRSPPSPPTSVPDPLAAIVADVSSLPPPPSDPLPSPQPSSGPTASAPEPAARPETAASAMAPGRAPSATTATTTTSATRPEPATSPGPGAPRRPRLTGPAPPPPPEDDPAAPRRRRSATPAVAPVASGRNLPQAIAVGVGLAALALLALIVGPALTMVLVEVVLVLAAAEYYGAVQRGGFRPATLLGLTAVAALPLATYWRGEPAVPLIVFLAFVVGVLWYLLGVGGKVRPTANLGVTMVGIVWVGVLGAFAALILKIPGEGVSILAVAIVAAVANDVGGFFIGRAMGRTPLSTVSPNKTFEGLVGGMIAALVSVGIVAVIFGVGPFSLGQALVFGLLTAVVAPLGDLAESLFKRDLGLKDMGSILPQHGGVLDRFDGMLFVLPAAYYAVRLLGLAG